MRTFLCAVLLSVLLSVTVSIPLLAQEPGQTAEEAFGTEEMAEARRMMTGMHGGQVISFLQADRLEAQGDEGMLWEGQGFIGGDYQRFWVKTDGEYSRRSGSGLGGASRLSDGEIQGLYSRPFSSFFDWQAGLRQDFSAGPKRTYGVIGVQGLAPYLFEIDTALFVSHKGEVTARAEAEYQLFLTQRTILMPRAEVNLAFQDVNELGIGAGLSTAEAGARLRYEIRREFAPYVGVSWTGTTGRTADLARSRRDDTSNLQLVFGLRLWW